MAAGPKLWWNQHSDFDGPGVWLRRFGDGLLRSWDLPRDRGDDGVDAAARRWSVGIAFLASHKLSAYNAISLWLLNSLETRWSLISTGNLSRNKPRNRQPGFSSSGRRANMVSMRAVGRQSPSPGWWISLETFCQCDRVYEETSFAFKSS